MDFLNNFYTKTVTENERNLKFWEEYLKSLKDLDFKKFSDKLTVPVLVPIGSRVLFRGELKHTSEVFASIGADYFAKCSIAQADILRQHRIKDAQAKVDMFKRGKEYLENQLSFRKENIYDNAGQEIVEVYSEDEDKAWRIKHRENVKKHKLESKLEKENKTTRDEITDVELWGRLEELELQEELENELLVDNTLSETLDNSLTGTFEEEEDQVMHPVKCEKQFKEEEREIVKDKKDVVVAVRKPELSSKLDMLQKVIDRQNELDERLQELKYKERSRSKMECDLLARLDEIEQLDELEDEMDRLDDIIEGEDVESDEENSTPSSASIIQRSVSFADEDESETLEITFNHSNVSPSSDGYDPSKGIQKPSDIYSAYPNSFRETTSILKKTKYTVNEPPICEIKREHAPKVSIMQTDEDEEYKSKTIIVKDIVERVDQNGNMVGNTESRPTSLFKKKRMQNKS